MDKKPTITIDDFAKLDIRVGKIIAAEKIPDTDKLIKFSVDLGEEAPRQILSGIAEHFPDPLTLVGKLVPVITNLAPRTIRGHASNGMIMYAVGLPGQGEGENFTTLDPGKEIAVGTLVR